MWATASIPDIWIYQPISEIIETMEFHKSYASQGGNNFSIRAVKVSNFSQKVSCI